MEQIDKEEIIEILLWYQEKAQSIFRYLEQKDKAMAIMAVVEELSLDCGKRADKALKLLR